MVLLSVPALPFVNAVTFVIYGLFFPVIDRVMIHLSWADMKNGSVYVISHSTERIDDPSDPRGSLPRL